MRIAFLIEQIDPSRGGVERYAFSLARELAARGEVVRVFTRVPPPAGTELPAGLEIVPVEVPGRSHRRRHERFDAALRGRMGELSGWDVVQAFGPTALPGLTLYRVGGGTHPAYLRSMAVSWPFWKRTWEQLNSKNRRRIALERRIFAQPHLHETMPLVSVTIAAFYGLYSRRRRSRGGALRGRHQPHPHHLQEVGSSRRTSSSQWSSPRSMGPGGRRQP